MSCRFHIDRKAISDWVRRYSLFGSEGLKRRSAVCIPPVIKEEIVREHQEKGISLPELSLRYDINRCTIQSWLRLVRVRGYASLYRMNNPGRPPKDMGRPKKKEPQTELEKLQFENAYLKAENALLKKVKALVEKQEARARLNGRRPSKS
jgi:transposase